jgi:hypothetical protein
MINSLAPVTPEFEVPCSASGIHSSVGYITTSRVISNNSQLGINPLYKEADTLLEN